MFRLEIFYNEMMEKIKKVEIGLHYQTIQEKELKKKEKS